MKQKTRPYDELEGYIRNYLRPFDLSTDERTTMYNVFLRIGKEQGYSVDGNVLVLGPRVQTSVTKEHAQ